MLQTWLGSTTLDAFREQHLARLPIAHPSSVIDPASLLDWDVLGAVMAAECPPDVLVVVGGERLPLPVPRSLDEVRAYLRMGIGLCLRCTEHCHPSLRRIADEFERDLGPAQVQIFVTAAGTHGFGWHYDDEDVFIAHTVGAKDYYFRANTVTPHLPAKSDVFSRYHDETSELYSATLIAGDFLYIPARWWHMAVCRETSLSVSVGVRPRPLERDAGRPADCNRGEVEE
jgi:hypothetical protein